MQKEAIRSREIIKCNKPKLQGTLDFEKGPKPMNSSQMLSSIEIFEK